MLTHPQKPIIAKDIPIMLFDGAFQGDLLQGVAAAILLMPNGRRYTVSQLVSVNYKDEAEYTALIIGLKKAQKLGLNSLAIKGDSDLVFNQVNGLTPVTQERLVKLYRIAIKLMRSFEKISLEWISPDQNRPAKSALKRCIRDALGREKAHQPPLTTIAVSQDSALVRLINKGEKATEEDYGQLTIEEDQWTHKSLSELRALIPVEVRDAIALQWQGDEENLAQMYRWHLRGLPPKMACRKVNLDHQTDSEAKTKLPWEEALNVPQSMLRDSDETSDPLLSLLSELDNPQENFEESFLTPPQGNLEDNESLNWEDSSLRDQLSENEDANLSFAPENIDANQEGREDTLPSESTIVDILKLIENLAPEEQITLAQELVKIPEMVNFILKAIADNVSKGNAES
ncbi:reverse transcriptase-like protein [Cyanothece sp. BG0011]|uniref:reverse transcriptase-like protein n=1 Tax=Cyanothece sp. BG0011 TaxID=2082950 RepID=UPI000D1F2322|nr:reverse transcriptase-like protein [Cyanothece sp. BG0011]